MLAHDCDHIKRTATANRRQLRQLGNYVKSKARLAQSLKDWSARSTIGVNKQDLAGSHSCLAYQGPRIEPI
jgi:hypothetical protein